MGFSHARDPGLIQNWFSHWMQCYGSCSLCSLLVARELLPLSVQGKNHKMISVAPNWAAGEICPSLWHMFFFPAGRLFHGLEAAGWEWELWIACSCFKKCPGPGGQVVSSSTLCLCMRLQKDWRRRGQGEGMEGKGREGEGRGGEGREGKERNKGRREGSREGREGKAVNNLIGQFQSFQTHYSCLLNSDRSQWNLNNKQIKSFFNSCEEEGYCVITGFMFAAPVSGAADVFKVPGGDILIVFLGFWLGFL